MLLQKSLIQEFMKLKTSKNLEPVIISFGPKNLSHYNVCGEKLNKMKFMHSKYYRLNYITIYNLCICNLMEITI